MMQHTGYSFDLTRDDEPLVTNLGDLVSFHFANNEIGFSIRLYPVHIPIIEKLLDMLRIVESRNALRIGEIVEKSKIIAEANLAASTS